MNQPTLLFQTQPLRDYVVLTKAMDRACFPEEMWLRDNDFGDLLRYEAETIIMMESGKVVGQAIILPETSAVKLLEEVDLDFQPRWDAIYSYSVAVLPSHQGKGCGAALLRELADQMRNRGYTALSAHVRARYGWNDTRMKVLQISTIRTVPNFWEDEDEVVQYQDARL